MTPAPVALQGGVVARSVASQTIRTDAELKVVAVVSVCQANAATGRWSGQTNQESNWWPNAIGVPQDAYACEPPKANTPHSASTRRAFRMRCLLPPLISSTLRSEPE